MNKMIDADGSVMENYEFISYGTSDDPLGVDFRNESGLKFVDISSEKTRTYEWRDGSKITIQDPLRLNVSKSGGHRLFDGNGVSHYITPGWNHLYWEVKEGEPNFVK